MLGGLTVRGGFGLLAAPVISPSAGKQPWAAIATRVSRAR